MKKIYLDLGFAGYALLMLAGMAALCVIQFKNVSASAQEAKPKPDVETKTAKTFPKEYLEKTLKDIGEGWIAEVRASDLRIDKELRGWLNPDARVFRMDVTEANGPVAFYSAAQEPTVTVAVITHPESATGYNTARSVDLRGCKSPGWIPANDIPPGWLPVYEFTYQLEWLHFTIGSKK